MVTSGESPFKALTPELNIMSTPDGSYYLHLSVPITAEQKSTLVLAGFFVARRFLEPMSDSVETDYVYTLSRGKQTD